MGSGGTDARFGGVICPPRADAAPEQAACSATGWWKV